MSEHGTRAKYAEGCRCADCVRAERFVSSGYRPDGWGKKGRVPWNKGRSKYANDEERKKAARERAKKWAKDNPDRFAANQKRYQQSEKGQATHRAWREANKERLSAKKAQWAKEHPESRRASSRAYYDKHFAEIKMRRYQKIKE